MILPRSPDLYVSITTPTRSMILCQVPTSLCIYIHPHPNHEPTPGLSSLSVYPTPTGTMILSQVPTSLSIYPTHTRTMFLPRSLALIIYPHTDQNHNLSPGPLLSE